jgi:hypothetical protein
MTKTEVIRRFREDGTLWLEAYKVDGKFHGHYRMWHANAQLERDLHFSHGVPTKGQFWDPSGREVCGFEIVDGTGTERRPLHAPDGALGVHEMPWMRGLLHGIERTLDAEGMIMYEAYWLNGKHVEAEDYLCSCEHDPTLPRPTTDSNSWSPLVCRDPDARAKKILETQGALEVLSWLDGGGDTERTLGEDTDAVASRKIADSFYKAGASKVWVFDINEQDQNSGRLMVELPDDSRKRKATLRVCNKWGAKQGFDPDKDEGQRYVLVMLD